METPVTARLKVWSLVILREGARVNGVIYDDSREKFPDGTIVTTSPIISVTEEPLTITTASGTVYQVEYITHEEWVTLQLQN